MREQERRRREGVNPREMLPADYMMTKRGEIRAG